jgi:ADP-ribosyl-[dinitrogen reductase] hydrolase
MKYKFEQLQACIFGLAVGDALGVPVEFKPRSYLQQNPVSDMQGYGTYNQPPGTWSDDSSLTFCLMESLCNGYNPKDIAQKFSEWLYNKLWTPYNYVFDVGITTRDSIDRFEREGNPFAGRTDEQANGNGSLMRVSPLAFFLIDESIEKRWQIIQEVASITHGHIRGAMACFIYIL